MSDKLLMIDKLFQRAPVEASIVLQAAYDYAAAVDVLGDIHDLSEYEDATSDVEREVIQKRYDKLADEAQTRLRDACLCYKTAYQNSYW
jgi:hypothetical protein